MEEKKKSEPINIPNLRAFEVEELGYKELSKPADNIWKYQLEFIKEIHSNYIVKIMFIRGKVLIGSCNDDYTFRSTLFNGWLDTKEELEIVLNQVNLNRDE